MPTSFTAFTRRDGLPRQLPDRGTYWHLGKEVKNPNTGGVPAFEHPELYKPAPKKEPAKGERDDIQELERLEQRHGEMLADSGIRPSVNQSGAPNLSPALGADGHVNNREIRRAQRAREGRRS
jgi:hypothetical protein